MFQETDLCVAGSGGNWGASGKIGTQGKGWTCATRSMSGRLEEGVGELEVVQ